MGGSASTQEQVNVVDDDHTGVTTLDLHGPSILGTILLLLGLFTSGYLIYKYYLRHRRQAIRQALRPNYMPFNWGNRNQAPPPSTAPPSGAPDLNRTYTIHDDI